MAVSSGKSELNFKQRSSRETDINMEVFVHQRAILGILKKKFYHFGVFRDRFISQALTIPLGVFSVTRAVPSYSAASPAGLGGLQGALS